MFCPGSGRDRRVDWDATGRTDCAGRQRQGQGNKRLVVPGNKIPVLRPPTSVPLPEWAPRRRYDIVRAGDPPRRPESASLSAGRWDPAAALEWDRERWVIHKRIPEAGGPERCD